MYKDRYIWFRHGQNAYALLQNNVQRILPYQSLYSLPYKEDALEGLLAYENQLIAVLDIAWKMHGQSDIKEYLIVISLHEERIALCAHEVLGNLYIGEHEWVYDAEQALPFSIEKDGEVIYLISTDIILKEVEG